MKKWDKVNELNYHKMKDFFYLEPQKWKYLDFVKGADFKELFVILKMIRKQVYINQAFLFSKKILVSILEA